MPDEEGRAKVKDWAMDLHQMTTMNVLIAAHPNSMTIGTSRDVFNAEQLLREQRDPNREFRAG
jgi:hypothetical protein